MKRLTFVVLLACSSVAFAQQQSSDAIPKELVKLLLGSGMYGSSFDIVVGAPADFPAELLPRGATPRISTTSPTQTMVIAEAPDLPAETARYERQLANAGWKAPPSSQMTGRGLLSSPPPSVPTMLCNGDRFLSYTVSRRPGGGSFLRISVGTSAPPRYGPCQPPPQQSSYSSMGMQGEIDLPAFLPPPGSRTNYSGGSGGGSDHYSQGLIMQTTLALADVLQHYRAQAEKHGWKYESQAIADGVGVVRFSLLSSKKEPVVATITATIIPGEFSTDVLLRLTRASTRPRTP